MVANEKAYVCGSYPRGGFVSGTLEISSLILKSAN